MSGKHYITDDSIYLMVGNAYRRVTYLEYTRSERKVIAMQTGITDDDALDFLTARSLSELTTVSQHQIKRTNIRYLRMSNDVEVDIMDGSQITPIHATPRYTDRMVNATYLTLNAMDRRLLDDYFDTLTDDRTAELLTWLKKGLVAERQDKLHLNITGDTRDVLYNHLSFLPFGLLTIDSLEQTKSPKSYGSLVSSPYAYYDVDEHIMLNLSRICNRNLTSDDGFCPSFITCNPEPIESDHTLNLTCSRATTAGHALTNNINSKILAYIISGRI